MLVVDEGKVTVEHGYQIWYRRIGGTGIPVLILHGGPGAGHDYLEPLARIFHKKRQTSFNPLI